MRLQFSMPQTHESKSLEMTAASGETEPEETADNLRCIVENFRKLFFNDEQKTAVMGQEAIDTAPTFLHVSAEIKQRLAVSLINR